MNSKHFFTFVFLLVLLAPSFSYAKGLEVSGWIPYWRDSQGIEDVEEHIRDIDTVFPFVYTIKSDGSLKDNAGLDEREWQQFFKTAQRKNVEVIPTIMTGDGELVHTLLSNDLYRMLHVLQIALMVEAGGFDGVDIDYEGKKSDTYEYFGTFLKELKGVLGKKTLSCTLEARTPPDSLWREVPETINYANDYEAIDKYCDRIQLMAYDQQRADIKLNNERKGEPYMPVADPDWVEKVIKLALESFDEDKVVLGIPTYGHNYFLRVEPEWYKEYTRIGALNVPDILDLADEYDVEPSRNQAGEMSFTYIHKDSSFKFPRNVRAPRGTSDGNEVAARALAYANKTGEGVTIRLVWYSDAKAIRDKIELAEQYNLKGVALFKFDGEEDQKVWRYLR